jgi:hypothetical protein
MIRSLWVQGLSAAVGGLLALGSAGCSVETTSEAAESEQLGTTEQSLIIPVYAGFVWANQTSGSYVPLADWSDGDDNTVTWLGTGRARVDFPFLGRSSGGNVQVTAYGSSNARCKVERWNDGAEESLSVYVRCHTPAGALVSTPFVVVFGDSVGTVFAWANQESAASYTPPSTHAEGVSNITRSGVGLYTVKMAGDRVGGNVQVTAYGTNANYCKVSSWIVGGDSATRAFVRCYDTSGQLADTQFTLRYTVMPGDFYPYDESYTWANDATDSSYTPDTDYQELVDCHQENGPLICSHGTDNLAGRSSKGHYWASYPGAQFRESTALVTAYGTDSSYCKVAKWSGDGVRVKVEVNCFDDDGNPADTRFSQLYLAEDDD